MEQNNASVPSDPQPDSFFTWDTGNNSGDYSFVHTAVELPKYPNGTITEEERQMLLLYMQSGHPELLINATNGVMDSSSILPPSADAVMCDQVSVRGYLETIVEENSDDLVSPSDGDEASVGWGSWDESDDDRVTVVEMETNDQHGIANNYNEINYESSESNSATSLRKEKLCNTNGYKFPDDLGRQNTYAEENQLDCYDLAEKQLLSLTGATSGNDCALKKSSLVCANKFCDNSTDHNEVSESSVKPQNNLILDTKPKVSPNSYNDSDFENLWVSANNVNNSNAEPFNPWRKNDYNSIPSFPDMESIDFNINNCGDSTGDRSLIELGSDELCLVPSGISNSDAQHNEEKLMFSDDFKDYFLSPESNKEISNKSNENKLDKNILEDTDLSDSKVRFFRIGFESEAHELVNDNYYNSEKKSSPVNSETEYSETNDMQQETLFSPRDGDVVYGSSWVSGRVMKKKPEKNSSSAETQFSIMHSESPLADNNCKSFHLFESSASDDECQQVSNSLSRWQHHSDLQHVKEATSPLTRWQHQTNLQKDSVDQKFSKQTYSDEDTDDGLPPQLKEIYSSFKMKDNRMGRIRIKEDKNNNFKKIGLWDNEAKVTLPPFVTNNTDNDNSQISIKKEIAKEEEFDDLEFDMFSVNKNKTDKSDHSTNADRDIDDALKSFNHLDDYSSNSDENSESENSYTVNTVENIDYENEDVSAPSTPDMPSLKNDSLSSCINEHIKSENENTCSDNSDNCPLCTDPSFKNSKIDIFSNTSEEKFIDNNVQSLLLNTYPKIKTLTEENNVPKVSGTEDSASPLTSSDSDEGIRTAKDVKKRIKRRPKDSSSAAELKHDDSGYVEDDEDDDEDDILEEKTNSCPAQINVPNSKVRKSLSSVFYESKTMTDAPKNSQVVPKNFEEFSCYLQESSLSENVKDCVINNEKLNIPENLSQFSSLLLDTELKKISCRDEMEKLIVNDIIKLREQNVAKFLKESPKEEMCDILSIENSQNKNFNENIMSGIKLEKIDSGLCSKDEFENINNEQLVSSDDLISSEIQEDENSEDIIGHSSEELDSEYYSYNLNSNVSKIQSHSNEINVNNCESQNKPAPLNKLPDVISDVLKIKTETETKEIASHVRSLSDQEADETKQQKVQNACSESDCLFGSDNQNIQIAINADEKQKPLSRNHCDADDIEFKMQTKVICTTASVTSDKEPVTNKIEVNDSLTGYSEINNTCEKLMFSDACEVAPSVGDAANYNTFENVNFGKQTISENSEVKDSEYICTNEIKNNVQNENIQDTNNDLLFNEYNSNENSVSLDKNEVLSNDYRVVNNGDAIELNKNNNERSPIIHASTEYMHDIFNDPSASLKRNDNFEEVAPSSADTSSELFATPKLNETDLMISRTLVAKGAYEGFSIENISPEAKVVSREVDSGAEHVTGVDYLAYDELASSVTRPFVNDSLCTLPTSDADALSDNNAKYVSEKVQSSTIVSLEVPEELELSEKNSNNPGAEPLPEIIVSERENLPESEPQVSENLCDIKTSEDEIVNGKSSKIIDNCQSSNLYKSKSVIVLQTEDFEEEDDEDQFTDKINAKNSENGRNVNNLFESSKSVNNLSTISITVDKCSNDLSKIKSSDDLCILSSKEKNRDEYKRSRSVGREDKKKEAETFDSWNGQSKSTPDLSRCHVPLSALLSKRVSERIQDYLGQSARENILNRSLPPSERSRHYRRICVSTETVVERAARFEARSKSTGRDSSVDSVSSRSGSCPPNNMRTGDAKFVRGYSKPIATVRPTIDIHRNSHEYDIRMVNGGKKSEEDLFELITGYKEASKVTHKPPVAPTTPSIQQSLRTCKFKGKIASARKEFFEKLSQQEAKSKAESAKTSQDVDVDDPTSCGLRRFDEFRKSAREERARLAQSHPDLGALEAAVRSSRRRIDQLKKRRQKSPPSDAGLRPSSSDAGMPGTTTTTKDGTLVLPYRRCTGEIAWASCAKRLEEAKSRSFSKSQEPLEIVDERQFKRPAERALLRAHDYENAADEEYGDPGPAISGSDFSRARSMDFLLDNREGAEPPENRLAQRVKSEHELRIERSLQNLTLPDWYTQSKKQKEGFILRRSSEGSAGESRKRWLGFSSSRTPSATSLTTPPSSYSQRNIIIPKRVTPTSGEWRYFGSLVSSRESLTPASPASLSPRECSSAAFNYGLNSSLSRWSSSRLSTSSAPLTSSTVHRSFRQPYLGWRAAAASSGGPSRSSPGVSPLNATTPLQGSRPGSPRRGSQDHHHGYGLQQNQITSAATLRPEGGDTDSGSRISPLALYDNSTNVFFNSNIEVPEFSTPEMRRDRYSYTQSLYSGTVIVSPGTEFKPVPSIAEDASSTTTDDSRFSMSKSPQPPPRIWMESSFVGTKKDGKDQVPFPQGRTIRIVPSDSVRSGSSSSVRSTCAPQTTMGEYVLRDFRRFGITL